MQLEEYEVELLWKADLFRVRDRKITGPEAARVFSCWVVGEEEASQFPTSCM